MPTTKLYSSDLGVFALSQTGETRFRTGQTVRKVNSEGEASIYTLSGHGLSLELGITYWVDGTREVGCLSRLDSPQAMDRLVHGFRFGIDRAPAGWKIRLRTPKIGGREWPTAHQTSLSEVKKISGLDLRHMIAGHQALAGTGSDILPDPGRFKNDLYVVFDDRDATCPVPVIAYSIVVAIPMYTFFA